MSLINMMDSAAIALMNARALAMSGLGSTAGGEGGAAAGDAAAGNTFQVNNPSGGGITGSMQDGGAFGNVTTAISTGGNSLIYIVMMLVGFVGVIGIGIVSLKLMVGGAQTKGAAKGDIGWILVALLIGFGAIAIVGLVQGIASGLFTTA